MPTQPSKTKLNLLAAAAQVIRDKGVAQLTLEAVADQAKVSKGGLLYHYPSKQALLTAMVTHLIDSFETAIAAQIEAADRKMTWLEAYVLLSFDPEQSQLVESAGILAAVVGAPELLEPLQQQYQAWQAASEASGLTPALATVVRLAADGLWFTELLDVSPLTEERRSQALEALLDLIRTHKERQS